MKKIILLIFIASLLYFPTITKAQTCDKATYLEQLASDMYFMDYLSTGFTGKYIPTDLRALNALDKEQRVLLDLYADEVDCDNLEVIRFSFVSYVDAANAFVQTYIKNLSTNRSYELNEELQDLGNVVTQRLNEFKKVIQQ